MWWWISQTGVNYVTYLGSASAPLSPLLDKDGKPLVDSALRKRVSQKKEC